MGKKKEVMGEDGKNYVMKEKKPFYKKTWFWVLAVVVIVIAIGSGGEGDEKAASENEKTEQSSEKVKESSEKVELTLEVPAEVEVDKEGNASISGTATPEARVSVGLGIIGDSVEADKDGKFTLKYELIGDEEEEITINASLDSDTKNTKVKVKPNSEVKAAKEAAAKAQAEADAKAEAEKNDPATYNTGITYDNLARTPDQYTGNKVTFQGKVIQVMEGDGYTQYRLAVNSDYDTIALVEIASDKLSTRVLENDIITIYGESMGNITYDSTLGGKITIPAISVNMFNIDGQG
ncbi:hypothetical protein [Enterococcus nangangensis]|uniref:hypothetical protein n=1 Tax=Enterococcus nangangensis TaxID=2559926 RepID=UPI0010F51761|nr:hypothetical protein [Enterococcus nangangensis]